MTNFSEEDYYLSFKKIRDQWRKYSQTDFIKFIFNYTYPYESDPIRQAQKRPWLVALLLKWILLDDQLHFENIKTLNQNEFLETLQQIDDLVTQSRMPQDFDDTRLFMRTMAYQQFIYQTNFSLPRFIMQVELFDGLDTNHLIKKRFLQEFGISIDIFLELSIVTITAFIETDQNPIPSSIEFNWFESLLPKYTVEDLKTFLSLISKPLNGLISSLRETDSGTRKASEYYEQSPFIKTPLIHENNRYYCIHPNLLFRNLEYFIYDQIKRWQDSKLLTKFGRIFEDYVHSTLDYSQLEFSVEKDLEKIYGKQGGQIDFIVKESLSNIFIDAKGVEMSAEGKVTHSANIVKDKVTPLTKAVKQAHEMVNKISNPLCYNSIEHHDENFILVVTFKELYIANGNDLYEAVAKNKLDDIFNQYKDKITIPLKNMYFITIDDFRRLCDLIEVEKKELSYYLRAARKADENPITKRFDLGLHITEWRQDINNLKIVEKESEAFFKRFT